MKIILTKHQHNNLLSEAMGDSNVIKFDRNTINAFQKVVKKMMKKKYDWFEDIQIDYLSYMGPMKYMGIGGVISVDMEWGANQWREFHYSQYFPSNYYFKTGEATDAVSFGDIIGSELGIQIKEIILTAFEITTGKSDTKTLSWSWLMTKFVEKEELVIEKKMKIRESEETEFIEKYEKNSKLAKKYEPLIINLLKKTFGDDLYNISTNHTNRAYGSIWINDPKTNTSEMFSGPKIIFTLEFINKNKLEQQQLRETTYNTIESFTPFNMKEYGCPIEVRFINYEKKEF